MRVLVLANSDSWYFRDLMRAAELGGFACQRGDFPKLTAVIGSANEDGQATECIALRDDSATEAVNSTVRPDVVLVRTMPPGFLEQVVFRMDVLGRWEASGVRVVNPPKALECAVDKYLTTSKCQAAGLPVPETWVCESEEAALAAFERLNQDVVVKPLFGSEGRGILRVTDPDLALRTFRTLSRLQAVLYLQRFIAHPGYDVRVLVLAGRVLGGMKRFAHAGDFRTNVSRQARAEAHHPSPLECDLAVRAAQATGAWFAGVDLLYDRHGQCYVIEVNAVPGWKAFARVNGMDVAAELLKNIANEL